MSIGMLPQRNTFVHFPEESFERTLGRSESCPGNFVPLPSASSDNKCGTVAPLPIDCSGNTSAAFSKESTTSPVDFDTMPIWCYRYQHFLHSSKQKSEQKKLTDEHYGSESSTDLSRDEQVKGEQRLADLLTTKKGRWQWADVGDSEESSDSSDDSSDDEQPIQMNVKRPQAFNTTIETRTDQLNYEKLIAQRAIAIPHHEQSAAIKDEKDEKKKADPYAAADEDYEWTTVKKKGKRKNSKETPMKEPASPKSASRGWDVESAPWRKTSAKKKQEDDAVSSATNDSNIMMTLCTQTPNLKMHSNSYSSLRPETSSIKPQTCVAAKTPQKLLCSYYVGIEQDKAFNVVRRLRGEKGGCLKAIAKKTGAQVHVRGRGSGFLEALSQLEGEPEPLTVCITAFSRAGLDMAVKNVESLLESIHDQYRVFCHDKNLPIPKLSVVRREQPAH